jgi:hypothetical protein
VRREGGAVSEGGVDGGLAEEAGVQHNQKTHGNASFIDAVYVFMIVFVKVFDMSRHIYSMSRLLYHSLSD